MSVKELIQKLESLIVAGRITEETLVNLAWPDTEWESVPLWDDLVKVAIDGGELKLVAKRTQGITDDLED